MGIGFARGIFPANPIRVFNSHRTHHEMTGLLQGIPGGGTYAGGAGAFRKLFFV
ncbi:MAG: hypothetical protein GWN16_09970 [Calditrichae bacterium]|nr:hypothetical protein [Calditrichia bacterium]NIW79758.1 hypothetical protein [Calditrichia bacterium]